MGVNTSSRGYLRLVISNANFSREGEQERLLRLIFARVVFRSKFRLVG